MKLIRFTAAATMLALATGAAYAAGTGKQGYFQIYNKTENHTAIGFYTNEGDGWSDNWLSEELEPGESAKAEFTSDSGECEQLIQIGWLGENGDEVMDEPISIDICEASNVYLEDNEISYD